MIDVMEREQREFTITRSVDVGSPETNTGLTSSTVVSSYSRAHIPHIEASESQKADIKRLRRHGLSQIGNTVPVGTVLPQQD
jgi:hypothetical protein